jgi:lipopolysaccharide transport system permease protein
MKQTSLASKPTKIIRPPVFSPTVLATGVSDLVSYWDLLISQTQHRLKVRYKQSLLGWAWALLQPVTMMLVYTAIFSLIARVPSQGTPYSLFVLCGILPWNFFQSGLSTSATGIITHANLITKVYFPREILPLSYVIASFVDLLIACAVLGSMMAWYHVPLHREALYLVPILAVEIVWVSGLSLIVSASQVRFRDFGIAMPLIMQLWMFSAPVVYAYDVVPRRLRFWYALDPMTGIVENFRRVLIEGLGADLHLLTISAIAALIVLPAGYMYFKVREATMTDII